MPIATRLTENIEIGAIRIHGQDSLEVVTTDGGKEVRNLRAEDEPRRYQVAMPTANVEGGDTTDYDSVRQIWKDSLRGLYPFYFHDFVDDEDVLVRFESAEQISAPAGHLRHIDTFTLKECLGE
jgi:hypothetical protein